MRRNNSRKATLLGAAGLPICAIALLLGDGTREGLLAWLSAFAFVAGLPLGALCLALVLRIVPGAWRNEIEPEADRLALTAPLLLVLSLPILIGIGRLYPWASDSALSGFKAVYLTVPFFTLRTLAILSTAALLAARLSASPHRRNALAIGGLIAFVLLHDLLSVDWLLSLDPEFHSSGFGLYLLSGQVLSAFCTIALLRLLDGGEPKSGIIGNLLLTLLLLWAYFAFMQYFIVWSGNLPAGVVWYRIRGEGAWAIIDYGLAASRLLPGFLLFFPPVRRSRAWLLILVSLVLLGGILETVWLALPAGRQITALSILSLVFALAGMLALLPIGRLAGQGLAGLFRRRAAA